MYDNDIYLSPTERFWKTYCLPIPTTKYDTRDVDKITKDWDRLSIQLYVNTQIDWDEIAYRLQQYSYEKFLITEYWYIVRNKKLMDDGFLCQLNHKHYANKLNVHHKTYEFHGREAFHLDSLMTLCESCHQLHSNGTPVKPREVLKYNGTYCIESLWRKSEEIRSQENRFAVPEKNKLTILLEKQQSVLESILLTDEEKLEYLIDDTNSTLKRIARSFYNF